MAVEKRQEQIDQLISSLAERDGTITVLNREMTERRVYAENLQAAVEKCQEQIYQLYGLLAERNARIAALGHEIAARNRKLNALEQMNDSLRRTLSENGMKIDFSSANSIRDARLDIMAHQQTSPRRSSPYRPYNEFLGRSLACSAGRAA